MKIIGVVPARYASTRFPGKPIADIQGRPMLWWTYRAACEIKEFDQVVCAVDDERIQAICVKYRMDCMITRNNHPDHISRLHEVASSIDADYYMCINGDEPLIDGNCIRKIIPEVIRKEPFFCGAYRTLTDPAETIDFANIKLAISERTGRCLYMSRTPVPYPRGDLLFQYKKYVGIECFNKAALDFFANTPIGNLEKAEDVDHLRFLENGIDVYFKRVDSESISVDTPKDIEKVRIIIAKRIQEGKLSID